MKAPDTGYARSGDVSIAYQVVGEGEHDLVLTLGYAWHLELQWGWSVMERFLTRLASFSRLILFDKRGTGLSDRDVGMPTLEERMDDVRAVMDAAESERAFLMGVSEGAPMSLLFAATYPERTAGLVLFGGMARSTWAPDYPWGTPADDLVESAAVLYPHLSSGEDAEIWAPSVVDDEEAKRWIARVRRSGVSPDGLGALFTMFLDIDVRHVLPVIQVPTVVMHRRGDRVVNRRAARWMSGQISGSHYVELPGMDHFPWVGDAEAVLNEVQEFVTGDRVVPEVDRVLATVLFTDIVDSTPRASELGDHHWKRVIDQHDELVSREISRHRGRLINTTGDGVLATFDGPARAVRCAKAIIHGCRRLELEVRTGVHTGEIELRGDDVTGLAVVIGQRVSALADAGEVLVSSTVRDLVAGSGLAFEDRGEKTLKGHSDEWHIYAAVD